VRKAKDNEASFAPGGSGGLRAGRRGETGTKAAPSPRGRGKKAAPSEVKAERRTARRAPRPKVEIPEEMLSRAMEALTPRARALWARRGLACRAPLDRTTQSMLLRQLYLAYFEEERFERAALIAEQAVALDVLPDVVHQDAARAKQATGDVEGAIAHLRLAARLGPPSRRAFHWWSLGSLYYLVGRHEEAVGALARAARWGTRDKPLYQGHLALAQIALGQPPGDLDELIDRLVSVPAGNGYGRFVLGQLAFHARRWDDARQWLGAFVHRSTIGRPAMAIALRGEVEVARQMLGRIDPSP